MSAQHPAFPWQPLPLAKGCLPWLLWTKHTHTLSLVHLWWVYIFENWARTKTGEAARTKEDQGQGEQGLCCRLSHIQNSSGSSWLKIIGERGSGGGWAGAQDTCSGHRHRTQAQEAKCARLSQKISSPKPKTRKPTTTPQNISKNPSPHPSNCPLRMHISCIGQPGGRGRLRSMGEEKEESQRRWNSKWRWKRERCTNEFWGKDVEPRCMCHSACVGASEREIRHGRGASTLTEIRGSW